jgi:dCMP deaminase
LHLKHIAATPLGENSALVSSSLPDSRCQDESVFENSDTLLDFVTANWKEHWVTTDIWDETVAETFTRRPFFLLVSVDAPVTVRWERFKNRCLAASLAPPSLATFVTDNDAHIYSATTGLAHLLHRAHLNLLNNTSSIESLRLSLRSLHLTDESRLRPSWDLYFMELADLAAKRANCMKRQVGCVLVREKRVVSTGYNGTPRGMKNCGDGGCEFCSWKEMLSPLAKTPQVQGAMLASELALVSIRVCVCMPRRTLFWRLEEKGFEETRHYTAIPALA